MTIDADLMALATSKCFAALTTLGPDGAPSTNIMWVDADDEHVLINTEIHRRKYRNMTGDPRVAIVLPDASNPYRYMEVRGHVVGTEGGQVARDHIDALSQRYMERDYAATVKSERVIVKVAVDKLYKRNW